MTPRNTALALAALLALSGCATTTGTATSRIDPFEPANRAAFRFNQVFDRDVVIPIVDAYTRVVPPVARQAFRNFANNVDDFFSGVNGLLQGKPEKAGHDFGRVIVNSSFGFGGLIDFASDAGIPRGDEDFGQTFGVWGIPHGPYLVIPFLGPWTARDLTGFGVRFALDPIPEIPYEPLRYTLYAWGYVELRARLLEAQTLAAKAALDPYTFIRRSYLQRRDYLTYDGQPPPEKDDD